jgi:hypothetical protein
LLTVAVCRQEIPEKSSFIKNAAPAVAVENLIPDREDIAMQNQSQIFKNSLIVGGAIGNCVHVAGVFNYLKLAESAGYRTNFLGAAVPVSRWLQIIEKHDPALVCLSYRLTPSALPALLEQFFHSLKEKGLLDNRLYYFGGTGPCLEVARRYRRFSAFFQGEEDLPQLMATLFEEGRRKGGGLPRLSLKGESADHSDFKEIIESGRYRPALRHHFGLPSLEQSIAGIEKIAESGQVDIISLAPDQNAQEFFFEPEKMDPGLDGTGGIPLRSEEELILLWRAAQRGNYPRLRIYSGTNNLLKWAEMSHRTIKNAWGTVPLFWYSVLDGRSRRSVEEALAENMQVISWYAQRGIPVEINEAHHWSLRESPDTVAVADFYIAAYNARKLGVKTYIAQLMFNTPRLTSAKMDLAKMLAKLELIAGLEDENFTCLKQVRAGLTHFSIDPAVAKGQLAASTLLSMAVKPQIIHVVSFSEADHAATPDEVIESCKIVRGVLRSAGSEFPDLSIDPAVQERKRHLVKEAKKLLRALREQYSDRAADPLSDPACLAMAVRAGFLDAPHLLNNPAAPGKIITRPIGGGYDAVDRQGNPLDEARRIKGLGAAGKPD